MIAAGGKPNTLRIEDPLPMRREYWREYRTYFHIGPYGRSRKSGLPQHQMVREHAGQEQSLSLARAQGRPESVNYG
jgi:hypothetical protein